MKIPRIPRIFETGLLLFLVAFWAANSVFEKTSVGKWVAGYNFELYPMSTFSVYLWPKIQGATLYGFEVIREPGDKPVAIDAFDMFHPLRPPHLDDEIAFKQLEAVEKAQRNHCATVKVHYHKTCKRDPSEIYVIPDDVGAMWLRSIRDHTGVAGVPAEIRFVKTYLSFDPDTYELKSTSHKTLMRFYPRKDWVAHVE